MFILVVTYVRTQLTSITQTPTKRLELINLRENFPLTLITNSALKHLFIHNF